MQTGEQHWSPFTLHILMHPRILLGVSGKCWVFSAPHTPLSVCLSIRGLEWVGGAPGHPQLGTEPFSPTAWGGWFHLPVQTPSHVWLHSPETLWKTFSRAAIAALSQWPLSWVLEICF